MNSTDFTNLLKEPCTISNEQISIIEGILKEYPYFQAAHVLYLKGLKKQNSYKYNSTLKTTAAYTTNRTVLFDFITQNTLNIEKKEVKEDKIIQNAHIVGLEIIDTKTNTGDKTTTEIEKPILESLQIGEPLDFDKNEKHSFNEWLQLAGLNPIKREEEQTTNTKTEVISEEKEVTKEPKTFDLIDQFLKTNPKIKPNKSSEIIDISTQSTQENEHLMTETLARVYLEQKKYNQAIKAFKILSLKYPEKSSFFADRIKAVQFLQKNNS